MIKYLQHFFVKKKRIKNKFFISIYKKFISKFTNIYKRKKKIIFFLKYWNSYILLKINKYNINKKYIIKFLKIFFFKNLLFLYKNILNLGKLRKIYKLSKSIITPIK